VDLVRLSLPPLPRQLAKLWWEQVSVPQAARRLGADVLWVPLWAAPFWQPVPTVVTIHDLIPLLLPEYRGGLLQRTYTALVSRTAQRAAAVIAVSEAARRDVVAHLRIPGERVFAVLHGPNQEGAAGVSPAQLAVVRSKYGLPPRFFLYLGGFDVRKNLGGTLRAYRRYLDRGGDPQVRLVIAGKLPSVDSAFFPDPQKIAAELQLGSSVQFCGWIDEADKPALYALATAYIFPSLYEGFGMMVTEAMQAGAPVVTSAR
jgi:glycosyltransferase involved in cell wall biosynthesis